MYREGPEGTPFHTMLVEGFVDGPVDACKSHWSNHNVQHHPFSDKSYIIDFDMQNLMRYFLCYRFMYLMGDIPLQKMVRIIFSTICALNFLYTSLNTKLTSIITFMLV